MNTPRTDAAWAKTFEDDDDQCRAGNAATDMRDACATLERELAALTAEHQRVCEVERELRAEVKRMTHAYEYDHKCLCEVQDRCHLWKQRAMKAEAELAAAKERLRSEAMDDYASIKDLQRELATEREKVRLLKLDKDRLDWYNGESYYQFGKSHKCMDSGWWWSCGYQQNNGKSGIQNIRDTIDSAMAHSKSGRNKYNVCKRIEDSIKEDAK